MKSRLGLPEGFSRPSMVFLGVQNYEIDKYKKVKYWKGPIENCEMFLPDDDKNCITKFKNNQATKNLKTIRGHILFFF